MSSTGQKWTIKNEHFNKIKELIQSHDSSEDDTSNSDTEEWRLRIGKSVFTLYTSGTLFNNQATSEQILELREKITNYSTSELEKTDRDILIGLDETGKGELVVQEDLPKMKL